MSNKSTSKLTMFSVLQSANKQYYNMMDNFTTKYLPEEYHYHRGVEKFCSELVLKSAHHKEEFEDRIAKIGSSYLNGSHQRIYLSVKNDIFPDSNKSILELLTEKGIIIKSGYQKEGYRYRFNDHILNTANKEFYDIFSLFFKRSKNYINRQLDRIEVDPQIIRCGKLINLTENDIVNKPTIYNFKEPKVVKLADTLQTIIKNGIVSNHYIAKQLFLDVLNTQINGINKHFQTTNKIIPVEGDYKIYAGAIGKMNCMLKNTISTFEDTGIGKKRDIKILHHRSDINISYGGRIFHVDDLGTVGISREIKAANYKMIEEYIGVKINNYDLKASQMAAICSYAKRAGLPEFETIKEYVKDPNIKVEIAKKLGIKVEYLKVLLLAKLFGSSDDITEKTKNTYDNILEDAGVKGKANKINLLFNLKNDIARNLFNDINRYFDSIPEIEKLFDRKIIGKDEWISNGCVWVNTNKFKNRSEYYYKKTISAFALQGLESYFIYTLINMATKYNYKVLSYEYDGIICIGEIPEEAINEAIRITGFDDAILEIKNIN